MTAPDLITIMDDYAGAAGQKLNAELLLKTLERVDPELMRPLYAVALADAHCQGKDPTNWDRKKVLDTLLDRELNFHFNRFQDMTGEKATRTLRSEMKELLASSCIHGFLLLDDVEMKSYPKLDKKMNDVNMNRQEFLEGLGILRTIQFRSFSIDQSGNPVGEPSEGRQKVIVLSCPDLIKEHLVLNLALEGGKKELLFPQGWEQSLGQLFFLRQLLVDYNERLKNQSNYWNTFFQATPQNILSARIYGEILWGYADCYPDRAEAAVDRLTRLYDKMQQDPDIVATYANVLVNLTVEQNLKERTATVTQLNALYQTHFDIPEITISYARELVNLAAAQNLTECTATVTQLDLLYQNHSDIPEVAIQYASGLFNLTVIQDSKECTEIIARLDALYQNHLDNPKVAAIYAKGLFNVTVGQNLKERTEAVEKLDKLHRKYPGISEIAIEYAKGFLWPGFKKTLRNRRETGRTLSKSF